MSRNQTPARDVRNTMVHVRRINQFLRPCPILNALAIVDVRLSKCMTALALAMVMMMMMMMMMAMMAMMGMMAMATMTMLNLRAATVTKDAPGLGIPKLALVPKRKPVAAVTVLRWVTGIRGIVTVTRAAAAMGLATMTTLASPLALRLLVPLLAFVVWTLRVNAHAMIMLIVGMNVNETERVKIFVKGVRTFHAGGSFCYQ